MLWHSFVYETAGGYLSLGIAFNNFLQIGQVIGFGGGFFVFLFLSFGQCHISALFVH